MKTRIFDAHENDKNGDAAELLNGEMVQMVTQRSCNDATEVLNDGLINLYETDSKYIVDSHEFGGIYGSGGEYGCASSSIRAMHQRQQFRLRRGAIAISGRLEF